MFESRASAGVAREAAPLREPRDDGFAVAHLMKGHVTIMIQYALIPWFWFVLQALLDRPSARGSVSLAGLVACFVFAAHPQILYYTLLFGGLWAVGSLACGAAAAHRVRFVGVASFGAVLALLLGAAQLAPALELARDGMSVSERGTLSHAASSALDGTDLLRLGMPNITGNPFQEDPRFPPAEYYHERYGYLGLAVPLLAAFGMTRATVARWQWGAVWLVLLALALSLGRSTPCFGLLARLVPGLSLFRCPGRTLAVASVLAALLAGRGFDALLRRDRLARTRSLVFLAGALIAAAALGVCAWSAEQSTTFLGADLLRWTWGEFLITALIVADTVAALAIAWRCGRERAAAAGFAIIIVVLADLGYNNARNFYLAAPTTFPTTLRARPADQGRRFVDASNYPRVELSVLHYGRLVPLAIDREWRAVGTNEGGVLPAATETLFRAVEARPPIALALASCNRAIVIGTLARHEIPHSLPRLRFVPESLTELCSESIELLRSDDLLRFERSIVPCARIVREQPLRIEIEVEAAQPGALVLADSYYPGWECVVDGVKTPIAKAHGVFRLVTLGAGVHRVAFEFQPRSFQVGMVCSALGAAFAALLLGAGAVRACLDRATTARLRPGSSAHG